MFKNDNNFTQGYNTRSKSVFSGAEESEDLLNPLEPHFVADGVIVQVHANEDEINEDLELGTQGQEHDFEEGECSDDNESVEWDDGDRADELLSQQSDRLDSLPLENGPEGQLVQSNDSEIQFNFRSHHQDDEEPENDKAKAKNGSGGRITQNLAGTTTQG